MRLKQYINELADRRIKVSILRKGKDFFQTEFIVSDVKYIFEANEMYDNMWSIQFDQRGHHTPFTPTKKDLHHAADVFSGVKESIKMLTKKYPKIEFLEFAPANDKLLNVYRIMAKKEGFNVVKADVGFGIKIK